MALINVLDSVISRYVAEIEHIAQFIRFANESLSKRMSDEAVKIKKTLSKNQVNEIRTALKTFIEQIEQQNYGTFIGLSDKVVESFWEMFIPLKEKTFLAEMSLAYLVSYEEAFIKDYIYQILINRKQILKSNSNITCEELLRHDSMKALVGFMAQREVDSLGYGSIDDVLKYFSNKFNINLSEFKQWNDLKEISYRRNIIIHNRAITNDVYCNKTGYKTVNHSITTDYEYVLRAADTISFFISFVHTKCVIKLKLEKKKT